MSCLVTAVLEFTECFYTMTGHSGSKKNIFWHVDVNQTIFGWSFDMSKLQTCSS